MMDQIILTYIVIMTVGGVLQLVLAFIGYTNRHVFAGTRTFAWLSLFSAIYAFGHALELTSSTGKGIMFWVVFQYLGMPFSAPATLILVLQYIGLDKHLNRKTLLLYYLIPVLTFLFIVTNDFHHLFYKQVNFVQSHGALLLDMTVGQWYVVHGSYTFGTLFAGANILIWYWIKSKTKHWKQVLTLLIGILLPITTSLLYLLGLTPYGIDPVPIVMGITGLLYLWAIMSTHMLTVAPVAKDYLFESMRDAVIVLDLSGKIVEFNPLASLLFPSLKNGKQIDDIMEDRDRLLAFGDRIINDDTVYEMEWKDSGKYYQVRISPIHKRNHILVGTAIVIIDITELKVVQKQLRELAYKDGLTKIYNRTFFMEKSKEVISRDRGAQDYTSLLLFDVDHFKGINDTFGHFAGDDALRHIVSVTQGLLKEDMLFGRYGGEEFIVLLPGYSLESAAEIGHSIRSCLENSSFYSKAEKIAITASFGVAATENISHPEAALSELVEKADVALYEAKRNGRNRVYVGINSEYEEYSFISH
ncbi:MULTISPECIES: histidine kinase N-terminal 7TM domain-containing protein [unclassified Niallia]|uniref:histidine kinase N-terminal 7TM domain-containing diguanylate cyclase n=1 Tax=unclassified Niallia TaxID=2837522 RepID=UPI001EDC258E|nr:MULTISPECIES: histidine kinase N-terminal 7TM domain-containing protein [unclassified Niallia]MDL0436019.1 histidine kinase N-terminal 7TM domain-containing protein [Niallia sp. SS-2023]UPO87885.1 diguanylate cyclase [Niallia sp. Man26]